MPNRHHKHFYHTVITTQRIQLELAELDLTEEEKDELHALAENNIHHAVIERILSELEHEEKKTFLRLLTLNDHNDIWRYLNQKISNLEQKIKQTAHHVIEMLLSDIEEIKKQTKK